MRRRTVLRRQVSDDGAVGAQQSSEPVLGGLDVLSPVDQLGEELVEFQMWHVGRVARSVARGLRFVVHGITTIVGAVESRLSDAGAKSRRTGSDGSGFVAVGWEYAYNGPVQGYGAKTLRVFLLDDHDIVRRGLRDLLASARDVVVVGESSSAEQATRMILDLRPNVMVLDVQLQDGTGIEVCRRVRSAEPEIRGLLLTSAGDDEALVAAILAGADGYLVKLTGSLQVLDAVRRVGRRQVPDRRRAEAACCRRTPCGPDRRTVAVGGARARLAVTSAGRGERRRDRGSDRAVGGVGGGRRRRLVEVLTGVGAAPAPPVAGQGKHRRSDG